MNIYSRDGTKVVFTDTNGYDIERTRAKSVGFIKDTIYTVKATYVSGFSTEVRFHEIEGLFNSVMFTDA